jgi:hypothetical protein
MKGAASAPRPATLQIRTEKGDTVERPVTASIDPRG